MNKFNVGDQVAFVCDYGGYKIEDVGVVQALAGGLVYLRMGYEVYFGGEVSNQVACFSYRLRLVNPISLEDQIKELLG